MTALRRLLGVAPPSARQQVSWSGLACLVALAVLVACTGSSSSSDPTKTATPQPTTTVPTMTEELRSAKERAAPATTDTEIAELVRGNSAFAFDLYQNLRGEDGNLFYSPYSISLALAMTYAGARGETERQMAGTLHFLISQENLHPAFNALDQELASRGEGAEGKDGEGFRLNIANAVWSQEDYDFLESFLEVLAESYGAGVRLMDFMAAPERARFTINDWVAHQTEGRIKDLIPPGLIDGSTRMVLTNAIYFSAAWFHPFDPGRTRDGQFNLLDGRAVDFPMMKRDGWFGYAKGEGYQAVELLYGGQELSMVILLPDEGRFGGFEESLDSDVVSQAIHGLMEQRIILTMPNFEFESEFGLAETLEKMGMPNAFDDQSSDFSGMDGNSCPAKDGPCLSIRDVVHKTFVSVDEEGTEAAAASAVVVGITSVPPEVSVDRPFIFLIRDLKTGALLFVGRVLDPRG